MTQSAMSPADSLGKTKNSSEGMKVQRAEVGGGGGRGGADGRGQHASLFANGGESEMHHDYNLDKPVSTTIRAC